MDFSLLEKISSSITENPTLTLFLLLTGGLISWRISNFFHQATIQNKDEKIDRLHRDIDEYRQRLSLDPVKGSPYSRMSLEELQNATFELTDKIREIKVKYKISPTTPNMYGADGESETSELLAWRSELVRKNTQLANAYEEHYRSDATLIRNELSKRLQERPYLHDLSAIDFPVNYHGIQEVIDVLEEKAKRLI